MCILAYLSQILGVRIELKKCKFKFYNKYVLNFIGHKNEMKSLFCCQTSALLKKYSNLAKRMSSNLN